MTDGWIMDEFGDGSDLPDDFGADLFDPEKEINDLRRVVDHLLYRDYSDKYRAGVHSDSDQTPWLEENDLRGVVARAKEAME